MRVLGRGIGLALGGARLVRVLPTFVCLFLMASTTQGKALGYLSDSLVIP